MSHTEAAPGARAAVDALRPTITKYLDGELALETARAELLNARADDALGRELIAWGRERDCTLGELEMLESFGVKMTEVPTQAEKFRRRLAEHGNPFKPSEAAIAAMKLRWLAEARKRSLVRAPARRRMTVPPPRQSCQGGRSRPRVRRTESASRSAGGGSSGDPDSDGPGEPAARDSGHADDVVLGCARVVV